MRTSYPSIRRSLGAGLASVGTVLLLVAGLLVTLEAPLASATKPTVPQHIEVTLCHATASATNPYVRITVDDDGSLKFEGHADHENDIIPGVDGKTIEDVDAACPDPYDVAGWGDCDGWYIQTSAPKGVDYLKIDGVDVGKAGKTEFIADTTPTGPLTRTFVVQWWDKKPGPDTLLHEETLTVTRDACASPYPVSGYGTCEGWYITFGEGPASADRWIISHPWGWWFYEPDVPHFFADPTPHGPLTRSFTVKWLDHRYNLLHQETLNLTRTPCTPPTLTLVKTWDGDPWEGFGMQVIPVTGGPPTAMDSGVSQTFEPGSYLASELGMPTVGYEAGSWGGDCDPDGAVTLEYGDEAVCTITNTELPTGSITIVKNAFGPDGPFAFTGDLGSFTLTTPDESSRTFDDLQMGTYTVNESPIPSGWQNDDIQCTGSYNPGPGSVEIYLSTDSPDITCTFYNSLVPASLTVVKIANGSGTLPSFPFAIDQGYAGEQPFTLTPTTSGVGVSATFEVAGGGIHHINEAVPPGWELVEAYCSHSAWFANGNGSDSLTLDAPPGAEITCTFVNGEIPTLTLVKVWGGDGIPWPGFGMQVAPVGGGDAVAVSSGAPTPFDPGAYQASELGDPGPGYEAGEWGGDCAADGTVTLEYGDEKICTIVNTDLPEPTLTVIKTWVDDVDPYLGFALYASPATGPDIPLTSGGTRIVEPGTYTVGETTPPSDAWQASEWGGDCAADGTVSLDYEEHKVCTISNELRPPPQLTLVKTWEGEPWDGFELKVVADPDFVEPMESGVAQVLDPGTYTATEFGMPAEGYEAGEWGGDCAANGDVTLDWGESKTCTITNYEIPTLTLTKTVVGGDAEPDDFELRVLMRGETDPIPMLSGVELEMEPGDYLAMETLLEKYLPDPWGGDCDEAGHVTIGWGDHLECTITNVDPLPKLTLVKIVVGGTAEPDDFDLAVIADAGGAVTSVLSGEKNDFESGDYTASETNLTGYAPGEWAGDCAADGSVTLHAVTPEVQDDLVCTITNVATTSTTFSNTTVTQGTIPTTEGGTTTTTTDPGDLELPRTGGGGYFPMLLGGLGLALLGAGLVLLAPRRRPYWVV